MPDTPHNADTRSPRSRRLPAYILAGGESSRYGSDKARADLDGTPLIRRIADGLAKVCDPVTVVAQTQDAYADLGLPTIPDAVPGCGPVQGLLTALTHRTESAGDGWALLTACDLLPSDGTAYNTLILELVTLPPERRALAAHTDRWHPMPGLYHTDLVPHLAAYLADGGRSFQGLLNRKSSCTAVATVDRDYAGKTLHVTTPHDLPGGLRLT